MNNKQHNRINFIILIVLNVICLFGIIILLLNYTKEYQNKIYKQNINDIVNINQASSNIASEYFNSKEMNLKDIIRYVERHPMTLQELLIYLDDVNSSDELSYQLIGEDCTGYWINKDENGEFLELDYTSIDYKNIKKIFTSTSENSESVEFSTEFTDQSTGSKSFARYVYISAYDETGISKKYTLMAVTKSFNFTKMINIEGGFESLSTILADDEGNYILRNTEYKSNNFFKFIYVYNELTLDEMNQFQNKVISEGKGYEIYQNSKDEECVYVYSKIPDKDWYCISCVPLTAFHHTGTDIKYTLGMVGLIIMMMLLDVIYLWILNRRLKLSANDARAANDAKTDFLSRMSHDIRTPINVITGMTELALTEKDVDKINEYLENIQSSGKFLLGLVNDILDMNKVESGNMELHPKPYSYSEFKRYINAVAVPMCEAKNIEFTNTVDNEKLTIMIDNLRINQIIFNLLSNASKFTNNNGHIALDIKSNIIDDDVTLDISVSDDGIGMSEEFQKKMYNAFTQAENSNSNNNIGTGLGLAIVKNLVELMNGSIRVESDEGKGTTFYIHIVVKKADYTENSVQVEEVQHNLDGKRILLCEDHPMNAMIIVKLLEKENAIIELAENGKIGTEKFAESKAGYYDAILMDIHMPVMNGLEATRVIRNNTEKSDSQTIPIIALTANAYDSDVQNCLDAGMNEHLAKPIDPALMYSTIYRYVNK